MSVWNWSDDFDLQEKFREIQEDLQPFGFGKISSDLLLKCCSAVVKNSAKPEAFLNLPSNEVREEFDKVRTGIFQAIDFLKQEFNIVLLKLLPMENILIVLASFFASSKKQPSPIPQEQNQLIKKWFWRSCFSERYARRGIKSTETDIQEITKLKNGEPSNLGDFDFSIDKSYFLKKCFRRSSIATETFILMLADNEPLNLIQGTKISLNQVLSQGNRQEFHHIFPKNYLKKQKRYKDEEINCLANFCILARADNKKISNKPPKEYRSEMPRENKSLEEILVSNFCFKEMFEYSYKEFLDKRAKILLEKAKELAEL